MSGLHPKDFARYFAGKQEILHLETTPPAERGHRESSSYLVVRTRMPQKTKSVVPPVATIGQNATSLDQLLLALKEEYLYNTRVTSLTPNIHE
jgi:hypothetical protein